MKVVFTAFRDEQVLLFEGMMHSTIFQESYEPLGYMFYGIRHTDDDIDKPITVEKRVIVNRWGGLLKKGGELLFEGGDYTALTEEESERFVDIMNHEPDEPMIHISLSDLEELLNGKK